MGEFGPQTQGLELTAQESQVYQWYAVERVPQIEIARRLELSQQRISQIVTGIRKKLPPPDLAAIREEALATYADLIRRSYELILKEGAPVTAGKDGDIVRDPSLEGDDAIVRDYTGRLNAIRTVADLQKHLRTLLGLDAAQKIESTGTIRYEVLGVNTEDLT